MLSKERLEMYRRMTPDERLALTLKATRDAWPHLFVGSPEVVRRRFERMRMQKAESNAALAARLYAAKDKCEEPR